MLFPLIFFHPTTNSTGELGRRPLVLPLQLCCPIIYSKQQLLYQGSRKDCPTNFSLFPFFINRGIKSEMSTTRRMPVLMVFIFAIFVGSAVVYLRLWAIDSTFSAQERDLLRKQFDRASMEAMDESAEWRMKYDAEVERSTELHKQLMQVKEAFTSASEKVDKLQKENIDLHNQVESLKRDTQIKKQSCHCKLSSTKQML